MEHAGSGASRRPPRRPRQRQLPRPRALRRPLRTRDEAQDVQRSVAASAGAPLISMNADRAARKILAACRRGQPSLILTFAARAAILGNALFPNLTGYWMKMVNRFLPKAGDHEGNQSRAGSQLRRLLPAWLTYLADEATKRNNQGPRNIDL